MRNFKFLVFIPMLIFMGRYGNCDETGNVVLFPDVLCGVWVSLAEEDNIITITPETIERTWKFRDIDSFFKGYVLDVKPIKNTRTDDRVYIDYPDGYLLTFYIESHSNPFLADRISTFHLFLSADKNVFWNTSDDPFDPLPPLNVSVRQ